MNRRAILETYVRRISPTRLLICLLLCAASAHAQTTAPTPAPQGSAVAAAAAPAPAPGTPSATVVAFYRAMRERRFREAFAMSIFKPAVEPLSAEEFEDLRPDFERQAMEVPEKIELTGEQISGDEATVFMKLGEGDSLKIVPIFLVREKGAWIIEDKEARQLIAKRGKKFFFETRIEVHHTDVERLLRRIQTAQVIYSAQNNGLFGDLNQLVRAGLVPVDLLSTESTGYHFHVTVGDGGKSFEAGAEPVRYGRTGRLSFYLDAVGLKSDDKNGKPLKGPSTKK